MLRAKATETTVYRFTYQEQVYNILERMIVSGTLRPGERLRELDLASKLGVSRSPVREAILQLEQEGLVTNTRKGGWLVSEISLQDIVELYDLRKLIEVYAAKIGCLNCPHEITDEMEASLREFEKEELEIEVWREANRRFHELIVLSCGNKKIHEVFMRTMKSLRWCTYLALAVLGRREQSISEHMRIVEAFLTQNTELVERAIRDHIETVQGNIRKQGIDVGLVHA
jgi:DNA-binding GntR family transcriptional regulator